MKIVFKVNEVYMFKRVIVLAFLICAGYLAGVAELGAGPHLHEASAAQAPDDSGTPPAPDFALADLMNGGKLKLSSLKGKWVFLNFWATWCNPCVYEMPMMNSFYKKMRKEGMEMVAVSVDEGAPGPVQKFATRLNLDFTILHDPDNAVMRRYGVRSIPHTFVVDPDGNIQAAADGVRPWDDPEMLQFFRGLMTDYNKKKKESPGKKPKAVTES